MDEIFLQLTADILARPISDISAGPRKREVSSWVYGIYVQRRSRLPGPAPELRPAFTFEPTDDCFLASWWRGRGDDTEDATAEMFRSARFGPVDSAIRTALARVLPICLPGVDPGTTRIEHKLIEEDDEMGEDEDSPIEMVPVIAYYW